jgi:hypothetical protein
MKITLSKAQWEQIGRTTGWIKQADNHSPENTGLALDGMNNAKAKKTVNNIIGPLSKGFFTDEYWEPVDAIFKTLSSNNINWTLKNADYTHGSDGKTSGKSWKFEVNFNNDKGRFTTLYGIIMAAWAGSIADPSDRYDLVAYVS